MNEATFSLKAQRAGAGARMIVHLLDHDGTEVFNDTINPCSAKAREEFLDTLVEVAPGLNGQREVLAEELLRISQSHAENLEKDAAARASAPGAPAVGLREHRPAEEEVSGAELLDELVETINRFVVLPRDQAATCALWCLFAATHDAFDISPMLSITSPTKSCGKSTLLSVLAGVVPRPLVASSISAAALFRSVEAFGPVVLADEVDALLNPASAPEDLRAVFNSGWSRASACVLRCSGEDNEPKPFSTWAAKLVAGIGRRPATIESRSITIALRRRGRGEACDKFRQKTARPVLNRLGSRLARWSADNLDLLRGVEAEVPDLGSDRLEDSWEPLLVVADLCGGEWPARARDAARSLSACAPDDEDAAVQLLEDLLHLFKETNADRLTTAFILERLVAMDSRPWSEWRKGRPLTAHGLGRLLKPFSIAPRVIRTPTGTPRGYLRADFGDAWARYLATPPSQSATSQHAPESKGNPENQSATEDDRVADRKDEKPNENNGCCDVADQKGGSREKKIHVQDKTAGQDQPGRRKGVL